MNLGKIYKDRRVLVTGHTGFKGGWLALWLKLLGARVLGYALEPEVLSFFNALKLEKSFENVIGNILDEERLRLTFERFKPEIVFHLAAQPLVRLSYEKPKLTYETNIIGTLNILEAARSALSVKAFVNVTTDKCYENSGIGVPFREDGALGGFDMYSSSKGCAEILSSSYRRSFLKEGFALATARAGNVIGGGDWGRDRLVPDCVRALNETGEIVLRNPLSVRPWQFVLEPLRGYLLLGGKLLTEGDNFAEAFNFGPSEEGVNVKEIALKIISLYGKGSLKIVEDRQAHEAETLRLDSSKAGERLGWRSKYGLGAAMEKSVLWYKRYYEGEELYDFSRSQIEEYMEA